uniref:Immunoglobulin V-set domain-containing protein n=1 Tax=Dicentrarchus labrax TaxID=13489 RepID=A0A8C4GI30_DICLA
MKLTIKAAVGNFYQNYFFPYLLKLQVTIHLSLTVSQEPMSISLMRVNSSAEITCSTSLSNPMGLYLRRGLQNNKDIIYLSLDKGNINRHTTAAEFKGRVHIADGEIKEGKRFTVQLALLALDDTNWYYCSWENFNSETAETQTLSSNERGPQEQCQTPIWDLVLIALSVIAFTVILSLVIGALVMRCRVSATGSRWTCSHYHAKTAPWC